MIESIIHPLRKRHLFQGRCILYILLLVSTIQTTQAQTHWEIKRFFGNSYQKTIHYLQKNKDLLRQHLPPQPQVAAFILALGFPELLRFSKFQNQLETTFLEILYVKQGTAYANFSIGRFQMKPSFVETLEKQAKTYIPHASPNIYLYQAKRIKNIRKKRVNRLTQLAWQLKYLHTLYKVLNLRYAHKKFTSQEAKLRFFAAAYNFGFLASEKRIAHWSQVSAFPYGRNHIGKQQNFTKIAWDFYQYEALKLFK